MFVIDADFDVEYTIDLMPHYKEYLSSYQIKEGKLPEDYMKIQTLYRRMAAQIKEVMPTLPFCRKYFEMLKVITFLTSYYKTLREMMKIPILEQVDLPKNKVPKAFPPIPVRYYTFHKLSITVEEVLKQIELESIKNKCPDLLDS